MNLHRYFNKEEEVNDINKIKMVYPRQELSKNYFTDQQVESSSTEVYKR